MRLTKEARDRILSLERNGRLTADAVVDDAKKTDSPLHDLFEWDVKLAARQHWLDTARELIRSVRVTVRHEHTIVSSVAYVRDPEAGPKEQGYRALSQLRTERELAEEALRSEIRRAVGVLKRIAEIAQALGITVDLDVDKLLDLAETLGEEAQV